MKIISGGQTGVDRAALDVALKHGIDCGGWCPAGRLDEFGRIPEAYPVRELEYGGYHDRTVRNVRHSDATVVIYRESLEGGTKVTVDCCKQLSRPHLLIDSAQVSSAAAAELMATFVRRYAVKILNIAGPRQTEWPEGYEYARRAVEQFVGLNPPTAAG